MARKTFLSAAVILLCALFAGCGPGSDSEETGDFALVVRVFKSGSGGWDASVSGGESGGGWRVDYPGVNAYRATHLIRLENLAVAPDGGLVGFDICSQFAREIKRLWFTASTDGKSALVSKPVLVNGRGQNVFVVGTIAEGQCFPAALEFDRQGSEAYAFYLDFLEIEPRMAYCSNRSGSTRISQVFTIDTDNMDMYGVTDYGTYESCEPDWSPAGEWIAFQRKVESECLGEPSLNVQVFAVHPDGSNLVWVSKSYGAWWPSFNPTGRWLAFENQDLCTDEHSIVAYNMKTKKRKTLYRPSAYGAANYLLPRWSPDGRFIEWKSWASGRIVHYYGELDPITGDTLGPPVRFLQANLAYARPDGIYRLRGMDYFQWAPDSKHAVIDADVIRDGSKIFGGKVIFDFQEVLDSNTLPMVPALTFALPQGEGEFARFSEDGLKLWFRKVVEQHMDLKYLELEGYRPATGEPVVFMSDQYRNDMPTPMRAITSWQPSFP